MANPTGALGAKLFMSATPLADVATAADAITDFQGLTIATEIGLIENFGEFGRQFDMVPFQAVADGRTYKLKGGYNDGQMTIVVGQDLSDAGQAAAKTAAEASNQNTYPFKMTIVGADASFDTYYWGAKLMSWRVNVGAVNNAIRATLMMEINTSIFVGAS
jgi:hypothetical protein